MDVGRRKLAHMTAAVDDVLLRSELAKPHRSKGVQSGGGDADLGAEPELAAVIEAGGGVEHHRGGVHLGGEAHNNHLILAVRVVKDINQALEHIATYGSEHTEAIVTNDDGAARRFATEVNASAVMINASTRFNDGGELGLGAEIGISTSRLHAFGPMGLRELTSQKYVVHGRGQVR